MKKRLLKAFVAYLPRKANFLHRFSICEHCRGRADVLGYQETQTKEDLNILLWIWWWQNFAYAHCICHARKTSRACLICFFFFYLTHRHYLENKYKHKQRISSMTANFSFSSSFYLPFTRDEYLFQEYNSICVKHDNKRASDKNTLGA